MFLRKTPLSKILAFVVDTKLRIKTNTGKGFRKYFRLLVAVVSLLMALDFILAGGGWVAMLAPKGWRCFAEFGFCKA